MALASSPVAAAFERGNAGVERIDATSGVDGRTPAVASPWLARLPAVLFAVPVGLFGLAAAWRRAKGFGWSFAEPVGAALAWTAAALAVVLVLLYAAKCLRHPRVIAVEFANPVTGSLMALIPLSLLLGTVCFGTAGQTGWLTLVALGRTAADDAQTALR